MQRCDQIIVCNVHHHHFSILCRQCAVNQYFECSDVHSEGCHFAGVIQPVATHCESDTFFSLFVRLIVTFNFSISDLSVLWYVLEFDKETCVGALNDAVNLEESDRLITKASFPEGLEVWVFHECHVFHLFARDLVYYCMGEILLCPMIGAQCNCLVGSFHVPEIVL
jgi:hypothetical protein